MSNPTLDQLRRITRLEQALENTRSADTPGIRIPYAQRVLNPFPLASSGGAAGDFPQSRALTILAFNVSVYVNTTNNGTNYWTLTLLTLPDGATIASVNTSAIAAGTWTRLAASSLTQPATNQVVFRITPTATNNPGAIYIMPEVIVA